MKINYYIFIIILFKDINIFYIFIIILFKDINIFYINIIKLKNLTLI